MIEEPLAGFVALRNLAAPRMALRAHLYLPVAITRLRAHRVAGRRIHGPRDAAALIEARGQAFGAVIRRKLARLLRVGPGHVPRAWAVAGPATHRALGPLRLEAVSNQVIVLAHAGRVAVGAHEVPILRWLGPVQLVLVGNPLARVHVEPPLPPTRLGACVPGYGKRLQPSIRERNQILLAEGGEARGH